MLKARLNSKNYATPYEFCLKQLINHGVFWLVNLYELSSIKKYKVNGF